MIKKVMCALAMVMLVVGFLGCPIAEQLLQTRLQGKWEYVDPDEDSRITLEFDGDEITRGIEIRDTYISVTGTFDVVDNDTIDVTISNLTETWDIEFFGAKKKMAVTPENQTQATVYTRVSFF